MNFNSLNAPKISNKNISNAKIRNSKPDVSSLQASPYEKFEDYEEIDYNILGNINNDGIVTVKDRTSLMNYSNPSFVGPLPNRYDVNKDGKIDNSDIDEINKIISEGDPKKTKYFFMILRLLKIIELIK